MSLKTTFDRIAGHGWFELLVLGLILFTALLFRLWQLGTVPLGLHFDEAIDLDQALRITAGARPIYTGEGWGREALYYYGVATVLQLVSDNILALRVTAVLCSLGTIVAAYLLVRRTFGRPAALLSAALLSVNYWSLFTARFGVRHMSLPLMLGLTILFFWRAWEVDADQRRPKTALFALAGLSMGLTLYTYQPARFAPFIFLLFAVYVWLAHRPLFRQNGPGFVVFGMTALLVSAPLMVAIQQADVELATRDWLVEPILKLLAGDPGPVLQNGLATLKMFSVAGDPLVAYNVSGRPVFVPVWTSLFFYVGLGLALWRWRQPIYPFLLIWLLVMLAPTVVTTSAPNYNRAIAAQVPAMVLTAGGMTETVRYLARRAGHRAAAAGVLLILLALGLLGRATWHDYFTVWPQQEAIPVQYNASVSVAARLLDEEADSRPVLLNTRNIEDADPIIFDTILDRADLVTRWVDTGSALVMPAGHTETRILLGKDRWIDTTLSEFAGLDPQPYRANDYLALYQTASTDWATTVETAVYPLPASAPGPSADIVNQPPLSTATFQAMLELQNVSLPIASARPGATVTFLTDWSILGDGQPSSLAFFAHLLDENHNIVAQQDGLGFPPHSWRAGDRMVHVHHLVTPADLPSGTYWIQFGLYRRETGERWLLDGGLGDRLAIGPVNISQ